MKSGDPGRESKGGWFHTLQERFFRQLWTPALLVYLVFLETDRAMCREGGPMPTLGKTGCRVAQN